jgi:hypothetical protein
MDRSDGFTPQNSMSTPNRLNDGASFSLTHIWPLAFFTMISVPASTSAVRPMVMKPSVVTCWEAAVTWPQ